MSGATRTRSRRPSSVDVADLAAGDQQVGGRPARARDRRRARERGADRRRTPRPVSPPSDSNTALRVPGTAQRATAHRGAERLEPRRIGGDDADPDRACARRSTSCRCGRAPARSTRWSSRAAGSRGRGWRPARRSVARGLLGPHQAEHAGAAAGRPARVPAHRACASATASAAAAGSSSRSSRTAPDRSRCRRGRPCRTRCRPRANWRIARSWRRSIAAAWSGGTPGSVVGMNSRSPSSTRGRNSPPSRDAIGRHDSTASAAVTRVSAGRRSAKWTNGRYSRTSVRVSGLSSSGRIRPPSSRSRSAGRHRRA